MTYEKKAVVKKKKDKGYKFVDLGLSVNWCNCNIGATKPEEYGWYFQWAGTTAYGSDRKPIGGGDAINFSDNSNCPYWVSTEGSFIKWSKYTAADIYSSTGTADNKLILELEDDAAHVHIGGGARMPTYEEYEELMDACIVTWVTNYNGTGINGSLFTLKSNPSKTLFFPAAGYILNTSTADIGKYGEYNSSSLYNPSYIYGGNTQYNSILYFGSTFCNVSSNSRSYAKSVRAVRPK